MLPRADCQQCAKPLGHDGQASLCDRDGRWFHVACWCQMMDLRNIERAARAEEMADRAETMRTRARRMRADAGHRRDPFRSDPPTSR